MNFVLKNWPMIWVAALAAMVFPALAQQPADNGVVGVPELRDFQLPGTRTTLPEQPPRPDAQPPAADQPRQAPAVPVTITPPPPPVIENSAPVPAEAPPPRSDTGSSPPALPAPEAAVQATPQVELPAAETPVPSATAPLQIDEPALRPAEEGTGNRLWIVLGVGLMALLALAFYRSWSRRPAVAAAAPAPGEALQPAPAAARSKAPAPAPVAALKAHVAAQPKPQPLQKRPWLELDFAPDRMVASEAEAAVHFRLGLRNTGRSHAKNVRILARMINASPQQNQEIDAFFAHPLGVANSGALAIIPHGTQSEIRASVTMPRDSARVYNVGGTPIFVPVVAVTVLYDWDEWGVRQSGQTSKSYVVGIQPKAPSEKMGPFRLDLGPRVYRSVGQRKNQLERVV